MYQQKHFDIYIDYNRLIFILIIIELAKKRYIDCQFKISVCLVKKLYEGCITESKDWAS